MEGLRAAHALDGHYRGSGPVPDTLRKRLEEEDAADRERLKLSLRYLDGWPEAQHSARTAFAERRKQRARVLSAGEGAVNSAGYAEALASIGDVPQIPLLLEAMTAAARAANENLKRLRDLDDEFSALANDAPGLIGAPDLRVLMAETTAAVSLLEETAEAFNRIVGED